MRYDLGSDKYLPVGWSEAFREIGAELNKLDPRSVVMYASGRASLEASHMYQLFGRMYGTSNFPDSSNMCHETTSVALPQVIGSPVGTVLLEDFEHTNCIFFFGHNTTTNAPRMRSGWRRTCHLFVARQGPTSSHLARFKLARVSPQEKRPRCGGLFSFRKGPDLPFGPAVAVPVAPAVVLPKRIVLIGSPPPVVLVNDNL